jgi:hypothetical protein
MQRSWRKKTIIRWPACWFPVPVAANEKQHSHLAPLPKKKKKKDAACTSRSLLKFFQYVRLTKKAASTLEWILAQGNPPFAACVLWVRHQGGFKHDNIKSLQTFNILTVRPSSMYLVQISAMNQTTRVVDNTHSICVFNNLIFDANMTEPLQLQKSNLDACCLGGNVWVYHHASKVAVFTPTKNTCNFFTNMHSSVLALL